jgi:hypothetical protein
VFTNSNIFLFSDLFNVGNMNDRNGVGKLFLVIKIGPGFISSLVYSLIKM